MKKLLFVLLLSTSLSSFAEIDILPTTGFTITQENEIQMDLQHHNGTKLILSKDSFVSEKDAENFCTDRNSKLDKSFTVLLLAMSGAATANKFISKFISFDFKGKSGIFSWTGEGKNHILFMHDGGGSSSDEIHVDEVNRLIREITGNDSALFKAPALCSDRPIM